MLKCTLLFPYPRGCSRGRTLDVDLRALLPEGSMIHGYLDTLWLKIERYSLERDGDGGRIFVTVSVPNRSEGVPETLWTAAGWQTCAC